ncbi:uncharacterized protein LOC142353329 [Convolutriloba macropyga]|uniref:uncharacterized protein LOC142353329 n=1 Tax=Convolutriloba macropyga TaxID=536237 RepID=UPI003F52396F
MKLFATMFVWIICLVELRAQKLTANVDSLWFSLQSAQPHLTPVDNDDRAFDTKKSSQWRPDNSVRNPFSSFEGSKRTAAAAADESNAGPVVPTMNIGAANDKTIPTTAEKRVPEIFTDQVTSSKQQNRQFFALLHRMRE